MVGKESDNEILFGQWKMCVEMANSISQRRDVVNNIFVTINIAVITAVSIVWNMKTILILIAGIVSCILWVFLIRNYQILNSVKFEIINSMEKNLPYQPFNDEWSKLKANKNYKDSTRFEKILPLLFIVMYIITIIIILVKYFK